MSFSTNFYLSWTHKIILFLFFFSLTASICYAKNFTPPTIKTIVIDPGHGGKDNGATGPTGLKEKNVVLDIAILAKKELESTKKYKVFLTRKNDTFVSLPGRKKIAKKYQPDILISIHCDGNKSRKVNGTTIYILSKRGEKFTIQHSLTQGDYVFNGEDSNNSLKQANRTMADTMKQNKILADIMLEHLLAQLGTKDMHVRKAGFKILKILDVPSILVEIAFITNWWEERQLKKSNFKKRAAIAIKKAVEDFFNSKPTNNN